jgi:polar amino acid transport system permease protein
MILAAYTAEVFRAGVEAIPKGQFEAAAALGLPFPVVLWKVILPQAVRIATPAQTSNCVAIAKDTSLASVVAMPDLLKQATDAQALFANPSPLISAALIYLMILWPLVRLVSWLEARAKKQGV